MKIRTFSIHSAAWAEQPRTAQELLQMPGFGSQRPGSPSQRRHYASLSPAAAARRGEARPGPAVARRPTRHRSEAAPPPPGPRRGTHGQGAAEPLQEAAGQAQGSAQRQQHARAAHGRCGTASAYGRRLSPPPPAPAPALPPARPPPRPSRRVSGPASFKPSARDARRPQVRGSR